MASMSSTPSSTRLSRLAMGLAAAVALTLGSMSAAHAQYQQIRGQVSRVTDGDTLVIAVGGDSYNIRLGGGVDAPETAHQCNKFGRCARPGQPMSEEARRALEALALNKPAVASCDARSYSRVVCHVRIDDRDMSTQMAQAGWTWADPRYARADIKALVLQAQAKGLGIWAKMGQAPVAPWTWRKVCWEGGICGL